eukprot:64273_1
MVSILWNSFVKSVFVAGLVLSIGNIEVRASNLGIRDQNIGKILEIIGKPQLHSQTSLIGKCGFCFLPKEDAYNFRTSKNYYVKSLDIYGNRRTDVCYRQGLGSRYHFEQRTTSSGQRVPMLTIEELYRYFLTVDLRELHKSSKFIATDTSSFDSLIGNVPRNDFVRIPTQAIIDTLEEETYKVTFDDQVDAGGSVPYQQFLKPTENFETIMARQPFKDFCASEDGSISCTLTTPPSNGLCTDQMVAKQFLGCFDLMSDSAGVTLIRTQKQDPS